MNEELQESPVNEAEEQIKKLEIRNKSLTTQLKNLQEKAKLEDSDKHGVSVNLKALIKHIAALRVAHARLPRGGSRSMSLLKDILDLESITEAKELFNKVREENNAKN